MVQHQEGTRLLSRDDSLPGCHSYGTVKFEPLEPRHPSFLCTKRDTIVVTTVLAAAFILIITSLAIGLPKIQEKKLQYLDTSFPVSSSSLLSFKSAVVVTDGQQCAAIGKDILEQDGSAVDAAIAALFCNGVVNPQSMGLGGGFFMTVFIKNKNFSEVIDAREIAPRDATKDMFNGNATLSLEGGLSIGVPGELRGYFEAHKKYGNIPWKVLIEPSIRLCHDGFPVSNHLARKLNELRDKILADASMRQLFFNNETGDLYKEGEILKRPILGATLSEIANKGADTLYTGELSKKLLKDIAECGGKIRAIDLYSYKPAFVQPTKIDLNTPEKLTLYSVPPPGSGLILSFILNILGSYNMTSSDFEDVDRATLMYHRIIESFKFAFAARTQLGDPLFVDVKQLVLDLESKDYAESIRHLISDTETFPSDYYKPVMETSEDNGTAHVSVIAPNGDVVTATSTINTYFGSLCRSSSTDIILNNVMDDFSSPNITNYFGLPPSPANHIEPAKRPLSSMCPSILVDGNSEVKMVIGGAGGTRMITSAALSIMRMLWLSEDIKEATDAPRIHHQLFPNAVGFESSFPKIYLDKLRKFGHAVQPETQGSIFLGIVKENGTWMTNVDYRKGGSSDGY